MFSPVEIVNGPKLKIINQRCPNLFSIIKALKDIILTEDLLSAYFLAQNPKSSKGTFPLENLFQAFTLLLDVQLLGKAWKGAIFLFRIL